MFSPCDISIFRAADDVATNALENPEGGLLPLAAKSASKLSPSPPRGPTPLFRFFDDSRGEEGIFESDEFGLKAGEKCRTEDMAVSLAGTGM